MKILIVSQVFWPDNVAVSLFVSDLAEDLAANGHQVRVIAGRYDYEDHTIKYPLRENHKGIDIIRLKNSGSGKGSTFARLYDFFTFNLLVFLKLMSIKRKSYDMVICSTVPPMLPFITALFSKKIAHRFVNWVMDLQPELSIHSGLIKKGSLAAWVLQKMGDYVFKKSDHTFALDHYMKKHIEGRSRPNHRVSISPLWPVLPQYYNGAREQNPFRVEHGFGNKIVIMYSGNHSYVHPLNDLLRAALYFKTDERFLFVFIGSGVRKKEVALFKEKHRLSNIVQLPFQPREKTHISLSAADIQAVVLGDGQVGYTHPNKIYGALFLGKPVLYIGPQPSHIADVLAHCSGNIIVNHGEWERLAIAIEQLSASHERLKEVGRSNREYAEKHLDPHLLRKLLVDRILEEGGN
jgi:colanic acid biosynthesis glycosyl transferase WcaI